MKIFLKVVAIIVTLVLLIIFVLWFTINIWLPNLQNRYGTISQLDRISIQTDTVSIQVNFGNIASNNPQCLKGSEQASQDQEVNQQNSPEDNPSTGSASSDQESPKNQSSTPKSPLPNFNRGTFEEQQPAYNI